MIDLHCHLGGAVPSSVLWEILCDSGLQTEFRSFENLHQFLTVTSKDFHDLDDFLGRYFHVTELIQSSPHAASTAVYHAVAKAYRRAEIKGMEIRYNPLKRVHGGHHTLGAIIMATVQGMQRVSMHGGNFWLVLPYHPSWEKVLGRAVKVISHDQSLRPLLGSSYRPWSQFFEIS